ncbi:MAG: hypothetical protein U0163_20770 [Gemmatimonadaceae bacterium]
MHRTQNLNSKGVIYVNGTVWLSGTFRGRATLYINNDEFIDDLTYVITQRRCRCQNLLGIITGDNLLDRRQQHQPATERRRHVDHANQVLRRQPGLLLARGHAGASHQYHGDVWRGEPVRGARYRPPLHTSLAVLGLDASALHRRTGGG